MLRNLLILTVSLVVIGCNTEVNAPGVKVKVGPGGAQVDAPGVKVNAGPGGAKVDLPGKDK